MKIPIAFGALIGLLLAAAVHIVDVHISLHSCRADTSEANAAIVSEYRRWVQLADEVRAGGQGPVSAKK